MGRVETCTSAFRWGVVNSDDAVALLAETVAIDIVNFDGCHIDYREQKHRYLGSNTRKTS